MRSQKKPHTQENYIRGSTTYLDWGTTFTLGFRLLGSRHRHRKQGSNLLLRGSQNGCLKQDGDWVHHGPWDNRMGLGDGPLLRVPSNSYLRGDVGLLLHRHHGSRLGKDDSLLIRGPRLFYHYGDRSYD